MQSSSCRRSGAKKRNNQANSSQAKSGQDRQQKSGTAWLRWVAGPQTGFDGGGLSSKASTNTFQAPKKQSELCIGFQATKEDEPESVLRLRVRVPLGTCPTQTTITVLLWIRQRIKRPSKGQLQQFAFPSSACALRSESSEQQQAGGAAPLQLPGRGERRNRNCNAGYAFLWARQSPSDYQPIRPSASKPLIVPTPMALS